MNGFPFEVAWGETPKGGTHVMRFNVPADWWHAWTAPLGWVGLASVACPTCPAMYAFVM
ncbi:MAG: hypothetical protein NTW96_04560 [Planctomycetia bacterium]|nr:hypothetical protein [Planctomycetia bacterium]